MNNTDKLFEAWYTERSTETGNFGFDMEEAAREAFTTGFSLAYPAMKEMLFDVARFMDIRCVQKGDEDKYLALIEVDGNQRGSLAENPAIAIYSLIKALANGEGFTKVEDLSDEDRRSLGLS